MRFRRYGHIWDSHIVGTGCICGKGHVGHELEASSLSLQGGTAS